MIGDIGGFADGLLIFITFFLSYYNSTHHQLTLAQKLFRVQNTAYRTQKPSSTQAKVDVTFLDQHYRDLKTLKLPAFAVFCFNYSACCRNCFSSKHRKSYKTLQRAQAKIDYSLDIGTIIRLHEVNKLLYKSLTSK